MLRRPVCAALLTALLVAACGGASRSASSSSSPASPATTPASTVSTGTSTTTATTSSRPPEVPKNKAPRHSKPTAPNTNVRIPAAFTIAAGGAVTPPLISVPASVTIELQLRNDGSKTHRVQLAVAHFAPISVPGGRSKTTDVAGVRKGDYRLLIDGTPRARIVVGAVPGP